MLKSSDPNNSYSTSGAAFSIPLSVRVGLGMNYFFTENIGMNLEFGLGGPLIQGGLALAF